MKFLPCLLLLLLVSCGPSDAKTPEKRRSGNPESIQFFETYSLKDISAEWQEACKYSAKTDPSAKGEVSLDEIGFLGLRNLIRISDNTGALCYVNENDRSAVDSILAIPEMAKLFPKDLQFMWALHPHTSEKPAFYELFAVKTPSNKSARIDGRHIVESVPQTDKNTGTILIQLTMTEEGSSEWERMTNDNLNKFIAITMNKRVLSCPLVMTVITGGKTQISGNFSMEEAAELSDQINGKR